MRGEERRRGEAERRGGEEGEKGRSVRGEERRRGEAERRGDVIETLLVYCLRQYTYYTRTAFTHLLSVSPPSASTPTRTIVALPPSHLSEEVKGGTGRRRVGGRGGRGGEKRKNM